MAKLASIYHPYRSVLQEALIRLRWIFLGRPFQWRVCPRWMLPLQRVPGLKRLPFLTLGELLLTAPLLALFMSGWKYTVWSPSGMGSGYAAWYCIVATFLLANKSTSVLFVFFGMSWEQLVPFHYAAALLSATLSLMHGYVVFVFDGDNEEHGERLLGGRQDHSNHKSHRHGPMPHVYRNRTDDQSVGNVAEVIKSEHSLNGSDPDFWKYLWDGSVNVSGTVMVILIVLLISLSASRWFRKKQFEVWLFLHILSSLGIVAYALVHSISTMKIIIAWWFLDWSVRYALTSCFYPKKATIQKVMPDVVELRFPRPQHFRFQAGQFLRIAVSEVGCLNFHPATISSAPYENEVTLHFRVAGDWTKHLAEVAEDNHEVSILLEGPYGCLSLEVDNHKRYPNVLLVCAGIGVTPMMSLARQLVYAHKFLGQYRSKIRVVWAVKDIALTKALPVLKKMTTLRKYDLEEGKEKCHVVSGNDSTCSFSAGSIHEVENKETEESVFQLDIYVTKQSTEGEDNNSLETADNEVVTHYQGRPDLGQIVKQTVSDAEDGSRVAVLACGPAALVKSTKVACVKYNSNGVAFDFHEEIFEY